MTLVYLEHPTHNFSGTTRRCYGCGCAHDSGAAQQGCPSPDDVGNMRLAYAPETPYLKPPKERPVIKPTLPPVVHDPLNMREPIDLKSLYPKLADIAAVHAAVWGRITPSAIERALRTELSTLHLRCDESLNQLQRCMAQQHELQQAFNQAYAGIEEILGAHPELLKP